MKKFLNEPKHFVDEMLEGILLAHPDQLAFTAGDLAGYAATSTFTILVQPLVHPEVIVLPRRDQERPQRRHQ